MGHTTFLFSWIFLAVLFIAKRAIPAPVQPIDTQIVEFMQKYGFLKQPTEGMSNLYDTKTYKDAIRQLQEFYNIPASGEVDDATRALVNKPRCGIPDVENEADGRRLRRFVEHGEQWPRANLKYYIKSHTKDLPKAEVDKGVETALQKWASVSSLTFTKVRSESEADITFLWATRSHGDISAFDGPGGSLAHAFYPDAGGDVHVDDDENWTVQIDTRKHNLVQVVTHELGHSLGLRHSTDPRAMMYAYINRHRPKLNLMDDDIKGIQKIYGSNTNQANAPGPTKGPSTTNIPMKTVRSTVNPFARKGKEVTKQAQTTRPTLSSSAPPRAMTNNPFQQTYNPFLYHKASNPSFCESLDKIDAAVKIDDSVYLFWKSMYFKAKGGLVKGYPRKIATDWNPLPDNIDAALFWPEDVWSTGIYLFFKGSSLYIFNKNKDFVRVTSIASFFSGRLPDNIDSAFIRSEINGSRAYFTKGEYYYTTKTKDIRDMKGPYSTMHWGFPTGLNAAFTYDEIATYFFTGNGYYASDALTDNIQVNFQFYPRRTAQWWLSCF